MVRSRWIRTTRRRATRWFAAHALSRRIVKVHGLLRVGTNYMEALLKRNFLVHCLGQTDGGWKHGPCQREPDSHYVFLVKNPYAWALSFLEWERIHGRTDARSVGDFLARPLTHPRLRAEWGAQTPLEAWNTTLRSWLAHAADDNAVFVRYEDLLTDFRAQLRRIAERFELRARNSDFVNIHARADDWRTPRPRRELDLDGYRSESYVEQFDDGARTLMRDGLDESLLARFDYRAL